MSLIIDRDVVVDNGVNQAILGLVLSTTSHTSYGPMLFLLWWISECREPGFRPLLSSLPDAGDLWCAVV